MGADAGGIASRDGRIVPNVRIATGESMHVLIVDDEATNLRLAESVVSRAWPGVQVRTSQDPLEALRDLAEPFPDLLVVDYSMPGMDGLEFVRRFRERSRDRDIPIVMITAEADRRIRHHALEAGVTDFLNKPVDLIEVRARVANLLALREAHLHLADRARHLDAEIRKAVHTIEEREDELVRRLSRAAEYRDPETGWHLQRMSQYSYLLAVRLGLPAELARLIRKAAPMHDIGKVGIPDAILLKPGPLDPSEMDQMRRHTSYGRAILHGSTSALIRLGCQIADTHHEKWDGTGYPHKLAGEAIPMVGRIVAVADVFDALTSRRPYKEPWPLEKARAFLVEQSGKHFDPACVDGFLEIWDQVVAVHDSLRKAEEESEPGPTD